MGRGPGAFNCWCSGVSLRIQDPSSSNACLKEWTAQCGLVKSQALLRPTFCARTRKLLFGDFNRFHPYAHRVSVAFDRLQSTSTDQQISFSYRQSVDSVNMQEFVDDWKVGENGTERRLPSQPQIAYGLGWTERSHNLLTTLPARELSLFMSLISLPCVYLSRFSVEREQVAQDLCLHKPLLNM